MDENILRQAKQEAAAAGITLGRLIEDAVRAVLSRRREGAGEVFADLPVFHGRGLRPGVDLADSASLADLMDDDAPR